MNYLALIIVAIAGIASGVYFSRCLPARDARVGNRVAIPEQSKKKRKNKDKVFTFVRKNGKVKNGDVEKMLGVSDATAERYLDELEKEGKIEQHGTIGQNVFYTPK